MSARDTYNTTVQATNTNLNFAGFTGQGNGTLIPNNTEQYPSLAQLKAALAAGQISQSQYVYAANQTAMAAQIAVRVAKDVLAVSEGGNNPA